MRARFFSSIKNYSVGAAFGTASLALQAGLIHFLNSNTGKNNYTFMGRFFAFNYKLAQQNQAQINSADSINNTPKFS